MMNDELMNDSYEAIEIVLLFGVYVVLDFW